MGELRYHKALGMDKGREEGKGLNWRAFCLSLVLVFSAIVSFGEIGRPVLNGTTVRCLNKEIAVNPKTGLLRISADGEELAVFRHIYPVRNLETGKCLWPGMHEPSYTNDHGRMVFDANVTEGGVMWPQYHQEVELMPDGLLRVSTKALYCPCTNRFQTVDGENGTFTLEWKIARGTEWMKTNETLTVFADDPSKSFSIIGRQADGVKRLAVCDLPHARMVEVTGVNKTFYIDIRRGVKRMASSDTMGGVDFLRVEGLHMPDFSCGNFVYNPSFEMGFKGWYSRIKGYTYDPARYEKPWFRLDRDDKLFGCQSMRLFAYHNRKNVKDVRELVNGCSLSTMPVSLNAGTYRFSCWAKADRKNCWLKAWYAGFRFSSCWMPVVREAEFARPVAVGEWTRHEMTFTLANADMLTAHITTCCGDGEGFVWLDGVTLEKVTGKEKEEMREGAGLLQPEVQAELLTSEKDNLVEEGDAIDARLRIFARPMGAGRVSVTVCDWQGRLVKKMKMPFACDAVGACVVPLDLKLGRGLYVLRYDFAMGEKRCFQYDRLTVVKSPGNGARWSRLFGHVYANDVVNADFRERLLRCKRLGINNVYHVATGAAEHAEYDKLGIYNANGQMVCEDAKGGWGLQGPDGAWYIRNAQAEGVPLDDAYLKRFRDAVAARARAFPHILEWEFSNEFFARAGRKTLPHAETDEAYDDWAKYMKAYVEGVHAGNPKAVAYSDAPYNMSDGGCEEMTRILRACAKIGCRFDGIAFHIYRFSPENPDLDAHYERMKKLLRELGYPETTPFHHGEGMHWGPYEIPSWTLQSSMWAHTPSTWPMHSTLSYDIGRSERRSAAWRMRTWLVGLKNASRVRQMNSSNTNNHGLDLHQTPRISQLVSATLSNHLGDADFIEDIRFAPFVRAFVFKDGLDRPVAAVWCHKEEVDFCREKAPTTKVALGDALQEVRDIVDADVSASHRPNAKGEVTFAVASEPKLFIGRPGSMEAFLAAFRSSQIVGGNLGSRYKVSVNPASPTEAQVRLEDFLTRGVSNYLVKTSAPLSFEHPVRVDLPKEKLGYTALMAKKIDDKATLESVDWTALPALAFPNRITERNQGRQKTLRAFRDAFDATYRLGWNAKGLFVEIDVKDADFSHVAFKPEGNRWDNDCAQVYFDTFANARANQTKGYDTDDYDYLIVPEPDGSRARVWRSRVADMQLVKGTESPLPHRYATDDHPIPVAFGKTADGYRYRVFFPAEAVLPLRLEKGSVVGLGLCVSDANDNTKTKWLSRREGYLTNTVEKNDCYNKPHLYPAVLLWE